MAARPNLLADLSAELRPTGISDSSGIATTAPLAHRGLTYQKLQENDIRLLTVHPNFTSIIIGARSNGPVRCTLKHYSFGAPSASTALKIQLAVHGNPWSESTRALRLRIKDNDNPLTGGIRSLGIRRRADRQPDISDNLPKGRRARAEEVAPTREVPGRFTWGDYVALSYTWGDPKETCEIIVNGKPVQVTVNLEAALRALRNKAPVKAGLKLWIDALCINQEDDDEKAVQVKRMAEIYQRAFDVVVWLGPATNESWKALKLIEILSDSWEKDQGKYLREYLDNDDNSLFELRPPDEPSLMGCWHALRDLMFRPYWKRVWIIQELLMSKDRSPVLCGSGAVRFSQLNNALCKWIGAEGQHILRRYMIFERLHMGMDVRATAKSGSAGSMANIAKQFGGLSFNPAIRRKKGIMDSVTIKDWRIDSERLNFISRLKHTVGSEINPQLHPANLVALGRQSEAGWAHDKVYAFLGLMDPGFTKKVTVNYKTPAEAAYTDFSVKWMLEADTLDMLTYCEFEDGQSPTWVPDWRKTNFQPLLYIGDHENKYCAGGHYTDNIAISPDLKLVEVQGVLLDKIDGLSATLGESAASMKQPLVTTNAYSDADELRDALWRTLLGNRTFDFKVPQSQTTYGEDFRALLDTPLPETGGHLPAPYDQEFYTFIETNASFRLAGRPLEKYFANDGRREPISNDPASVRMMKETLLDSVMRATWMIHRRRLITTKIGLVGVVPRAAQRGDYIAVLQGCGEPLVLRRKSSGKEDNYQVIGTCYVHGLMEGELLQAWGMPSFKKRSICLC